MKKVIFFLVILFINQTCFSIQEEVSEDIMLGKLDDMSNNLFKVISEDIDAAKVIVDSMMTYSNRHNYKKGLGISYGSYGVLYGYMGNQGESIEHFIKSATIFESIGDERFAAKTNRNLGVLLIEEGQFEEAKLYITKALDYYLKRGKGEEYFDYSGLGLISIKMNEGFDKTMLNLNKAEKLALKKNDTVNLSMILSLQGSAHTKYNKDIPKGITLIRKALQLIKINRPNDHYSLGRSYSYLGEAYLKKKNYIKALIYNDSSLAHYKSLNYFKGLRVVYENRKEIFASQGNYQEGFEAFELFNKYNDSLSKKDKINQLFRVKTKYETEQIKDQKEIAEAKVILTEAVSKQNKNYFIGSTIIGFLILLTSIFYFSRLKARKKMELIALELDEAQKRLAVEKDLRVSELKALKSQMNPHFIFNALNSIQDYIITNEKKLAREYLVKFSRLIRIYLEQTQLSEVLLTDEVKALELYLQLEKARFDDNFNYIIYVDESLDKDTISVPSLFIQPYVENALKHGLMHKKEDKLLNIKFDKLDEATMLCAIIDNGIGREASAKINKKRKYMHKSFATSANEKRVTLINKAKSESKISVEIIDLYDIEKQSLGTKVALKIPI